MKFYLDGKEITPPLTENDIKLFNEIEKSINMGRTVTVMPSGIHAIDTEGTIHKIIALAVIRPYSIDTIYEPGTEFFNSCVFDGIKHEIHEITPEGIIIK